MMQAHEGEGEKAPDAGRNTPGLRRGGSRAPLVVEYLRVAGRASGDDLRRRERELERLIVKAACRRAWRLAAVDGSGHAPGDDDARARGTDDGLPSAGGAR